MTSRLKLVLALGSLILLTLLASSCEDGALTPSEGSLFLNANPSNVVIDVFNDETTGQTTIEARVLAANDLPIKDAEVRFSADGGTLTSVSNVCLANRCSISNGVCIVDGDCPASQPTAVMSDSDGFARDVLILNETVDATTTTVTAQSGTLEATTAVTLTRDFGPDVPRAIIVIDPPNQQLKRLPVAFDGGQSTSVNPLTCFQWTIDSSDDAEDETYHDTVSTLSRTYATEQSLTVQLQVSDSEDIDCTRSATPDPALFSVVSAIESYEIVCDDTTAPIADAGSYSAVALSAGTAAVAVSGSNSRDDQSGISSYVWDCETSSAEGGEVSGETATCTYTSAGLKTIRLTVTNGCDLTATDLATVQINP